MNKKIRHNMIYSDSKYYQLWYSDVYYFCKIHASSLKENINNRNSLQNAKVDHLIYNYTHSDII
jgi:hypothetical protein